jgi:hypothetical protein
MGNRESTRPARSPTTGDNRRDERHGSPRRQGCGARESRAASAASILAVSLVAAGPRANGCGARPPAMAGSISWQPRQDWGLTTLLASAPCVLFTPTTTGPSRRSGAGQDTIYATVWARTPEARCSPLPARRRDGCAHPFLRHRGQHRPGRSHLVLRLGYHADGPITVAALSLPNPQGWRRYRPSRRSRAGPRSSWWSTWPSRMALRPLQLTVEAFAVDATGATWFVPRTSTLSYSYRVSVAALDEAARTRRPARALRATRFEFNGPITATSITPNGSVLLVKTPIVVYAFPLTGSTAANAFATKPWCRHRSCRQQQVARVR